MTNGDRALTAVLTFLAGGVIGAGAALLLAPQSGKKTRKVISDFAEDMKEHAQEYAERLKEKIA